MGIVLLIVSLLAGCATSQMIPVNAATAKQVKMPDTKQQFKEIQVDMDTAIIPTKTKWVRKIRVGSFTGSNFRHHRKKTQHTLADMSTNKDYSFMLNGKGTKPTNIKVSEGMKELRRDDLRKTEVFGIGNVNTNYAFSLVIIGDQPTETRGVLLGDDTIYSIFPIREPASATLPVGYDIMEDSVLIARVDATRNPRVWFAEDREMSSAMAGGIVCLLMRSVY